MLNTWIHSAGDGSRRSEMLLTNGEIVGNSLTISNSTGLQTPPSSNGLENPGWAALALVGIKKLKAKGGKDGKRMLHTLQKVGVEKRKRKDGGDKLAWELKKLDSSVIY